MAAANPKLQFVLKVASRCNLNCSYCYVYNKGDDAWRSRPAVMPEPVFEAALRRIHAHCLRSGQRNVRVTFHGGEPCLAGIERFARWCRRAREVLGSVARVGLSIQTNGTLLDAAWIDVFRAHNVEVGLSLDGPEDVHDAERVDHKGRGSYAAAIEGAHAIRAGGLALQILAVIKFGADGLRVHRHFLGLGATFINYLLPDFTHDQIGPIRRRYGPTPCADFLLPVFEDWWQHGDIGVKIPIFWNIARLVLGGESEFDMLGNSPFGFLFVETDGAIEGLDVLKICRGGVYSTGLNVLHDDFGRVADVSDLHRATVFDGMPLPTACRSCHECDTCAGGYLPHRYSHAQGFDNPSVWCADLLRLFAHIRDRLGVPIDETPLRRQALRELSAGVTGMSEPVSRVSLAAR